MTNAERYHFADFTEDNYRHLLRLAREQYTFRRFNDLDRKERCVLWRHDIDFSPQRGARLAEIEAEERVQATYFVLLRSRYYNLFEKDVTDSVRRIIAHGHTLGLHFDGEYHGNPTGDQLTKLLAHERDVIRELFDHPIATFAFHNPSPENLRCQQWECAGMVNTYAAYFRDEMGYCSDSNGYWRHDRLEDILRAARHERLQVLTHPVWWTPEVTSQRERLERCLVGRASMCRQYYEQAIAAGDRVCADWE